MKIKINFAGKELERKVYTDKKGDKFIQHHNEKWLLNPRTNEIMYPVTNNLTSALWEKHNYIDPIMHNLDKVPPMKAINAKSALNTVINWYAKEKEFLDNHYEVDSYALDQWIDYAKRTFEEGK